MVPVCFLINNGRVINNSTWVLASGATVTTRSPPDDTGRFVNNGTLMLSDLASVGFSVHLENNETVTAVSVSPATLTFDKGHTSTSGTFNVNGLATLEYDGADEFVYMGGNQYTGNGAVLFRGVTARAQGGSSVTFDLSGAGVVFSGTTLTGSGQFINEEQAQFGGATIEGTTGGFINRSGGTVRMAGTPTSIATEFSNEGTVIQSGVVDLLTDGELINQEDATYDIAADVTVRGMGGRFVNRGTVVKSAGNGIANFGAPFELNDGGEVTSQSGELRFQAASTSFSGGQFTAEADARIEFKGNTTDTLFAFSNGEYAFTGEGEIEISRGAVGATVGGTTVFNMNEGTGELLIDGGTLTAVGGTVRNEGTAVFRSGTLQQVSGDWINAANGTFTVTSGAGNRLLEGEITNQGDFVHEAGTLLRFNGATLVNEAGGVYDLRSGVSSPLPRGRTIYSSTVAH